jgi:hypothetical protein
VRALSRTEPAKEDIEQYMMQTHAEKNDRGAAILMATNLENALQFAISNKLQANEDRRKELFEHDSSPIGTFSKKIIIGHTIQLFRDETRNNLEIIRAIRNAFAHAKIPIAFDTKVIMNACAFLKLPRLLLMDRYQPKISQDVDRAMVGRKRFQVVCENTSNNLLRISLADGGFNPPPRKPDNDEIALMLGSLP